ncbi:MAG TPA: hypothetical protein VH143_24395 [Kofleriaceae bacterium]|jgi:hypothetical protein|nr:hypothetical protein [Kofleriaceae bacterium]
MRDRDDAKRNAVAKPTIDVTQPGKATLTDRVGGHDDVAAPAQRQQFHTIRAGALYTDDGAPIVAGDVPAHKPVVVMGKLRAIALRGDCVLASYDGRSGWMQTSCLPSVATRELARTPRGGNAGPIAHESRRAIRKRKRGDDDDADHLLIEWPDDGKTEVEAVPLDEFDEFFVDTAVEQRDGHAYGYVIDGGGEQIYGWIDAALLV